MSDENFVTLFVIGGITINRVNSKRLDIIVTTYFKKSLLQGHCNMESYNNEPQISQAASYEFNTTEEKLIGDLAGKMKFVSYFLWP